MPMKQLEDEFLKRCQEALPLRDARTSSGYANHMAYIRFMDTCESLVMLGGSGKLTTEGYESFRQIVEKGIELQQRIYGEQSSIASCQKRMKTALLAARDSFQRSVHDVSP